VCHMNIGESSVDLGIHKMLLLLQDSWLRLFPTWCCMLTRLCYFLHIVHGSTYSLCFLVVWRGASFYIFAVLIIGFAVMFI
jgi:hypothetical protein